MTSAPNWKTYDHGLDDRIIAAFMAGYAAFRKGMPRPADRAEAQGWDNAQYNSRIVRFMGARPEGCYHANPNGEV